MKSNIICAACGTTGEPKRSTRGSFLIELVLWLCFIIPGLIYSLWRLTTRRRVCRSCGSAELIPQNTPRGRELATRYHGATTAIALLSVMLAGCAAMGLAKEYEGVKRQVVTVEGTRRETVTRVDGERREVIVATKRNFWVFQNADQNRVWVQDSPGTAFGKGLGAGFTLGAVNTNELQAVYQKALMSYLAGKGRTCTVATAQIVPDAGWEFRLRCSEQPHS